MTPSPALHAQLRPVIGAQWINLGLCVSLLSVAFALRHSVSPAVWIRSTIIVVVSLVMLLCGMQMRRGRRWAYVRAKWIAALGTIGFVDVAALPGPFPVWMRIEQGAQALVFLALAWMLTRPALASFFPPVKAWIHTGKANPLPAASARDASFDYLRAFIVLLVLLHHSVLAYAVLWPAQPRTFRILPAPIVDPQRWAGFDVLAAFNDTFFMALMFLLSGLFVSAVVYVPMELAFGAERWLTLGPFSFQASRLLLYATYFLVGLQMGAFGIDSGFLARSAGLARRWPIWLSAGLAVYALRLAVIVTLVLPVAATHRPLPLTLRLLSDLTLVLCCSTISFAFIALFCRFAIAHQPVLDRLSASSYGMYLIHHPLVPWPHFALLAVPLGPIAKGAITYVSGVVLSLGCVVALTRAPVTALLCYEEQYHTR